MHEQSIHMSTYNTKYKGYNTDMSLILFLMKTADVLVLLALD